MITAVSAAKKSLSLSSATEISGTASPFAPELSENTADTTGTTFTLPEISKSATAPVPTDITNLETYTYHATAKNTSSGEVIETTAADFSLEGGNVTFSMSIPYGTWILETTIKDSANTIIYKSAEIEKTFSAENSVFRADFILKPVQSTNGSGKVFLSMKVPSQVNAVTIQLLSGDAADWPSGYFTAGERTLTLYGTQKTASIGTVTDNGTSVSTSAMSVKSGSYLVKLNFYDTDNSETQNILYSVYQTINVYDGLTTNKWSEPQTSSINVIKTDGTFEVTTDLITMFALTNFYVDGTNGSDSNPGSFYAPAKTVAKVVSSILSTGDSSKDYTINITGTVVPKTGTTTTNLPSGLDSKVKTVTIQGTTGSETDILDGQGKGTTLTVSTSKPVTIKNLKITGGQAENGGGINISSSSKVSIEDASIDENTATKYGGGIYNEGILYLSGSTMIGKTGTDIATSNSHGNIAKESGAGIYNKTSGKIYIGYDIDGETSELTGGICRNFLQNSTNSTALGGGIYNGGNVYFDTGKISYNFAYNGSGIYAYGNVEMTGGTIEGNEGSAVNDAGCGGGVFVGNGKKLTMSGNAQIKNNKNMAHGAGVYLHYNGCTLVMNGGAISGNTSKTNGGAVYMHDMGDQSYNHSFLQMGGNADIPYGGQEKQNDVFMLDTHSIIDITGTVSTDSEFMAVIPKNYAIGTQILSGTEELLASECCKFYVPKPESETEHFFVLEDGKLGPIATFPNGIADGTQINPDDNLNYDVMKYSFINDDNLKLHVPACYRTTGYAVVEVDGAAPQTAEVEISDTETETIEIIDDGYRTLTVTLPNYTEEPIVFQKRMYVKIKPVRLFYQNRERGQWGSMVVSAHNFYCNDMDIRGRVELHSSTGQGGYDPTVFEYQGSNYWIRNEEWYTLDGDSTGRTYQTYLYNKNEDYVWIWYNLWRNQSTGFGTQDCQRMTLAQMKKVVIDKCGNNTQDDNVQRWTYWTGNRASGDQLSAIYVNWYYDD